MNLSKNNKIVGFAAVLAIALSVILFFGVYVTIGDGIFAGLMLKGLFFPPIEKFYLVTNGSNRFLLTPMTYLYNWWPQINWFDVSQLVPGLVTLTLTLYLIYQMLLTTFDSKKALAFTIAFSALFAIILSESTILYDPLSSSLILPFIVLVLPHYCNNKWSKTASYIILTLLLLLCWQIRFQGIFVGLVPAMALLGISNMSPRVFFKNYKFQLLLIAATFVLLIGGSHLQDRSITPEEAKIAELDKYIYTFSDGMIVKPGTYDLNDPADSIKLMAYYTFYFAEPTDTALAYMKNITYPSVLDGDALGSIPNKWGLFWQGTSFSGPMTYRGYGRFMWYMLAANIAFLFWAYCIAPNKTWLTKSLLWSVFIWCYFVSLGVAVKMIYKLAAPLTFFALLSFVYLGLKMWHQNNSKPLLKLRIAVVISLVTLLGIAAVQINTFSAIKHHRKQGLAIKQEIITEMNEQFADRLLVFDFFSMVVLENEIGQDNTSRKLKPRATMFGDFYMSLFPSNKTHLEALVGTSDFVPFFEYCAKNPDKVVLVMSQHRIDLIQAYLRLVKGVSLDFVPFTGDFNIENLEHSFYEVPLKLNYYTVHPSNQ